MFRALKTRDSKEANLYGIENRIHTTETLKQKHKVAFHKGKERYYKWLEANNLEGIRYIKP